MQPWKEEPAEGIDGITLRVGKGRKKMVETITELDIDGIKERIPHGRQCF